MSETTPEFLSEPIPDFFLNLLVDTAISSGKGAVTVFVGGRAITGRPVTPADFFRACYLPSPSDEDRSLDPLREIADKFDADYKHIKELRDADPDTLSDEDKKLAAQPRSFLNLLDARYLMEGGVMAPTNGGVPMRIRYSAIDAWIPGEMSAGGPQE